MHFAGPHDSKTNTCAFTVPGGDCNNLVVTSSDPALAQYDIYVIGIETGEITAVRYGLGCSGTFYFYGWTGCADLELPTGGWPGCGEGQAQTFGTPQTGPNVTLGILDTYIYGDSQTLSTTVDPRTSFAEWCDGTEPDPLCDETTDPLSFGAIGFNGQTGVNNCGTVPTEHPTWAQVKSIYR
jgi:hypothetical protein